MHAAFFEGLCIRWRLGSCCVSVLGIKEYQSLRDSRTTLQGPPEPEPHVQQQPQRQLQRRGEQEQRHWPPPRGWVDPHLMTRLYPRRDPLAVAGLPGQAIHSQGRGFGEPPNSLVDVIEQNWMGPAPASGHPAAATPGLPQPPPNPAAVACAHLHTALPLLCML